MNTVKCSVRKVSEGFEGTMYVPGLKPTKLIKKNTTSVYANRHGVTAAAKTIATKFGFDVEFEDTK